MNFQSVKAAPGQYVQLQAQISDIKHMSGEYGDYALGKALDVMGYEESSPARRTCAFRPDSR
jgi:hypothetical protein